jgi:hypothetical protein
MFLNAFEVHLKTLAPVVDEELKVVASNICWFEALEVCQTFSTRFRLIMANHLLIEQWPRF